VGRRTSAWIAGTLGVGLTASIVWAQQAPGPGVTPRGGSGASKEPSEPPSLYGASGTRGARYLMRNGLDYLQYQQYDRALKYLRDAEALDKQLTAGERQQLKKGIEQAQSGLRAAADAATPYALSDRSRHRTGFTPARPEDETAVAARAGSTFPADRSRLPAGRAGGSGAGAGRVAADDMPGEPIRLASAEGEVGTPAQAITPTQAGSQVPRQSQAPASEVPVPSTETPVDVQSARAEIPTLNAPEIPVLTAVPSSPDAAAGAVGTLATPPAGAQPSMPPAGAAEPALPQTGAAEPALPPAGATTAQVAPDQGPAAQAPAVQAPVVQGPAVQAPATTTAAPTPILLETPDSAASQTAPGNATPPANSAPPAMQQPEASVPPAVQQPEASVPPVLAPASDPAAGSDPALAPTTAPAPTAPATGGLVPTAMQEPAAANGPAAPAFGGGSPAPEPAPVAAMNPAPGVEPEKAPLPPLGAVAMPTSEAAGPAHRESEEPAAVTPTAAVAVAVSPGPAGVPEPAANPIPNDNELPPLPAELGRDANTAAPAPEPVMASAIPTASPATVPAENVAAVPGQESSESAVAAEAPAGGPASTPSPASNEALPPLPDDKPAGSQPVTAVAPAPEAVAAAAGNPGQSPPAGSDPSAPAGAVDPTATAAPAAVAPAPAATDERPIPVPQPDASAAAETNGAQAATAPATAGNTGPAPTPAAGSAESNFFLPPRDNPRSTLRPEEERRVAEIKARQEREELLHNQVSPPSSGRPGEGPSREGSTSNLQSQTYDISRAPSPAEARPIKAIPVPEDWVPLAARTWSPQRKYFAAAATCHLPLYFQDAALERYGHPVEQFVGPVGRFLSYPVDDPKQSTQRNQIIQPFFSAGLMALQIAAWPYNAIMDPPWEAQYDLGYYRPGDMVPTDIYWLPLHGYGPPLRGNHY
jgi:hypothetical protein